MCSPLAFDSIKKEYSFPPLKGTSSFGTVGYDAYMKSKIKNSTNQVFKATNIQKLNTSHNVCGVERTQLLTILAMSVQNIQLAGYLITVNRIKFLFV